MSATNNIPLHYKGQTIWTNARLLRVFTLLLTDELKSDNPSSDLSLKSFYLEFNFESIFQDERDFGKVKESIERINTKLTHKDFLISNNFGQRVAAILKSLTPNISHRELGKEVADLTSIKPGIITELFIQIERLLHEEEPIKTDEKIPIHSLLGRWKSKTIVDNPDFDFNFNMTDVTPSQNVNLVISQTDHERYSILVSIPAQNWSTNTIVELNLIQGQVLLDKGILKIANAEKSKTHRLPIIRATNGLLETYLFKTRIVFEKSNAR